MSYVNNVEGNIDITKGIGTIESIITNGNVTTVSVTAQEKTSNVNGKLGIAQIIEKDYSRLSNKPSINGVELEGNKTTKDLGIEIPTKTSELENDSDFVSKEYVDNKTPEVDLSNYYNKDEINAFANQLNNAMPQIVPLEEYNPEEQYEDNKIPNTNTLNYVIGMVSEAFDGMSQFIEEVRNEANEKIFVVNYTLNPQTMQITYISKYSADIIQAFNEGKKVTFSGYVQQLNVYVSSELQLVDGKNVFTYPLLKVNLGEGEKNYFFKIQVSSSSASIEMSEIGGEDNNIFIVEYTLDLTNKQVPYVSKTQQEIIDAHNEGKKVMFRGTVPNTNVLLISELNSIDHNIPYTYPFMRTDLGEGIYNYFFRISVYREYGNIEPYALVDTNKLKQTETNFQNIISNVASSRPTTDVVQNMVGFFIREEMNRIQNRLLPENVDEGTILKYVDGSWTAVEDDTFTVEYQLNPQTMTITDISHYSTDIKQAYNAGKNIIFRGYVLGLNVYVSSDIRFIDGNMVSTQPLINCDLGQGMLNYLFKVNIGLSSTSVAVHILKEVTNDVVEEFAIEQIEKLSVSDLEEKTVKEVEK